MNFDLGKYSEDYTSFGLFKDVHSFCMSHTFQAVSIHSDDLISTFQSAVLNGCPLQTDKSQPLITDQKSLNVYLILKGENFNKMLDKNI